MRRFPLVKVLEIATESDAPQKREHAVKHTPIVTTRDPYNIVPGALGRFEEVGSVNGSIKGLQHDGVTRRRVRLHTERLAQHAANSAHEFCLC